MSYTDGHPEIPVQTKALPATPNEILHGSHAESADDCVSSGSTSTPVGGSEAVQPDGIQMACQAEASYPDPPPKE